MRSFFITYGNAIAQNILFLSGIWEKNEKLIDISLKLEKPAAELIILTENPFVELISL